MIEAGKSKPAPFDVVVVHSFGRFFRDHFELEFYVRKLAKNGVKLVSITQEMGDDPMHVMMPQIMALFDEYQSKENARHVMRALKENARQGLAASYGLSHGGRRASQSQDQEEAGNRPAPCRYGAADLPPRAGRQRAHPPAGP